MTLLGLTTIAYLWHYLVARVLYDQVLRPLERGQGAQLLTLVAVATVGYVFGRHAGRPR